LINEDLGHHAIGDHDEEDYGVVLVDRVDALEVSVDECYGRETSWEWFVNTIDVDILDNMEMTLLGLARLSSIGKFACNGVDYTSNLLGELIFLFLQRSLLVSCW